MLTGVQGVLETVRSLTHLIIDMDGVLYRGALAVPGTREFIAFLRSEGIGFQMATNNSTRTPEQFVSKLAGMEVEVAPHEILTSSLATAGYLAETVPQATRVFVVGMDGLRRALHDAGMQLVEEDAEYVVAGMDFEICYERLALATLQIRAGAKFLGTNPDLTFPSERGIVPGAGALLALLEAATGVKPKVIGKPETAMMEQALHRMGADRQTTAVLGDRLETDILAGERTGMKTILVLTGVTTPELLAGSEIQPDFVFDSVAEVHATWEEAIRG